MHSEQNMKNEISPFTDIYDSLLEKIALCGMPVEKKILLRLSLTNLRNRIGIKKSLQVTFKTLSSIYLEIHSLPGRWFILFCKLAPRC